MHRVDRSACEEVFRRLDSYLDRELAPDEMRMVCEHLDDCALCAAEHRFERQLLDDVKEKVRRIAMPADVRDRVHAAIARARAEMAT